MFVTEICNYPYWSPQKHKKTNKGHVEYLSISIPLQTLILMSLRNIGMSVTEY